MKTCPKCGKEIMRHWKYCNQCGRGCVLLDMDREYMRTLSQKSTVDLEKRLKTTSAVCDILVHENTELKEQYDLLQENFHKLCQFKGGILLENHFRSHAIPQA